MAGRQPLDTGLIAPQLAIIRARPVWFGLALAGLLGALILLCLAALFMQTGQNSDIWPALLGPEARYALRSALIQASLSTILSVSLGLWIARAMVRRGQFRGRAILLNCAWLAMIVPTSVAALAILGIWGPAGWMRAPAAAAGLPLPFGQFGLTMVILAHLFFNVPLAMRMALSALSSLPASQWQLAASLGLASRDYWRLLEWPVLRGAALSAAGLIFLLCFTSFALVLMLGGGPRVTTLEVAIYTALRFDFDLPLAASLCVLQLAVCGSILWFLWHRGVAGMADGSGLAIDQPRADRTIKAGLLDWLAVGMLAMLVMLPLLGLLAGQDWQGGARLFTRPVFWQALGDSLLVSLPSALIALLLGLCLSSALVRARQTGRTLAGRLVMMGLSASLLLPSLVLGTALFLLFYRLAPPASLAYYLVMLANILLALPFVIRLLEPRLDWLLPAHDRLADQLGLLGIRRFIRLTLPALRPELQTGFALAAALSLGDLGVIALFGSSDFQTLPWLLYQYQNRYGGAEADMLALVMLGLVIALFGIAGRLVRLPGRRLPGRHLYSGIVKRERHAAS